MARDVARSKRWSRFAALRGGIAHQMLRRKTTPYHK